MDIVKLFDEFLPNEEFAAYKKYGNGHINSTFLAITKKFDSYVIQKINHYAFKDVDLLMNNICEVTSHLSNKNIESIQMLKASDGKHYVEDEGEFYRMYRFMDFTMTFEKPEGINTVKNAAKAFGNFHKNLADLDANKLGEVIPHFHDTPKRYNDLVNAIKEDKMSRVKNAQKEIEIVEKVKLLKLEGKTYKEISDLLNITPEQARYYNLFVDIDAYAKAEKEIKKQEKAHTSHESLLNNEYSPYSSLGLSLRSVNSG